MGSLCTGVSDILVYYSLEDAIGQEGRECRATAETHNDGGIVHITVYGTNEVDCVRKLAPLIRKIEGPVGTIYWERRKESLLAP